MTTRSGIVVLTDKKLLHVTPVYHVGLVHVLTAPLPFLANGLGKATEDQVLRLLPHLWMTQKKLLALASA